MYTELKVQIYLSDNFNNKLTELKSNLNNCFLINKIFITIHNRHYGCNNHDEDNENLCINILEKVNLIVEYLSATTIKTEIRFETLNIWDIHDIFDKYLFFNGYSVECQPFADDSTNINPCCDQYQENNCGHSCMIIINKTNLNITLSDNPCLMCSNPINIEQAQVEYCTNCNKSIHGVCIYELGMVTCEMTNCPVCLAKLCDYDPKSIDSLNRLYSSIKVAPLSYESYQQLESINTNIMTWLDTNIKNWRNDNIKHRVKTYFNKSLELLETYSKFNEKNIESILK
jgi:hypothetical protein